MRRMAPASAFVVSRFAAAESICSGVSPLVKAMRSPRGDQTGPPAPVSSAVSGQASPPSASGRIQICGGFPSRALTKASWRPSGENAGAPAERLSQVSRRAPLPSVRAIQSSRRYLLLAESACVTT
jgi:hypothetical protein